MEMTLRLPQNYVEIEQEEMMYLDGGGSSRITGTLGQLRSRLAQAINGSHIGIAGSVGAALLLGKVGAILGGGMGAWFNNVRRHASTAHHQANQLITRHGINRRGTMTTTWTTGRWVTGISVRV